MDFTSSDSVSSSDIDSSDDDLQHNLIKGAAAGETTQQLAINPTEIFEKAIAAFCDSLPPENRSQLAHFANAEALILNIESIAYNFKNKSKVSRLMACCHVIKRFAQTWEPFFEVTSILVSSHPEYAAFAWSAIRLIFMLGSNFVTFLEKLCNMFDGIRYSLSIYHRQINNIIDAPNMYYGKELAAALSLIYTDIIEFCQQATSVFVKKNYSGLQSIRAISSITLIPFDTRFRDMIERFALHRRMFEGELNLLDQKMLIKHFARLELNFQNNLRVQEKAREKEKRISERKRKQKEFRKRRTAARREAKRKELYKKRVRHIQSWVDIPKFMNIFEDARRTLHPGTCRWLLQEPSYISWRDRETGQGDSPPPFASRILSLQANPGFGKTILSVIAIEDLKATVHPETFVTFFHFDGEDEAKRDRFKAWRAIVAQLLYESKNDRDFIDAATILMDEGGSGQLLASDDEIEELLGILLHRFSVFLVLDGIDECRNCGQFLLSLFEMCASTDTKVLLLSRPTITFPLVYQDHLVPSWRLRLTSSRNYEDIRMLLESHLESMSERGLIPAYHSQLNLVENIASRSNGMFLWVRLLLNYVSCSVLSPAERLHRLQEANLLEGLENIYDCILKVIESRYIRERKFIFQVLNWMLIAYRRMTFGEMHTALAIRQGCLTTDDSYIVDFEQTLSASSLGLVEVNAGKIQFIHTSVKDYLEAVDPSKSTFKAVKGEAHLSLSSVCLSYLTYDMPITPLSWHSETATGALSHIKSALQQFQRGTSRIHKSDPIGPSNEEMKAEFRRILEADFASNAPILYSRPSRISGGPSESSTRKEAESVDLEKRSKMWPEIESHFPFIGYAARHWHDHALDSLTGYSLPLASPEFAACNDFLSLLSAFMLDRKLVTTWVEACSLYGFIPSVQPLVGPLSRLGYHHRAPGPAQREFLWMCSGLRQLAAALQHLSTTHTDLLKAKPSAIWSNAIRGSTDANFWPPWEPPGKKDDDDPDDDMGVRIEDANLWGFGAAH